MTLPRSARRVACLALLFALLSSAAPAADAPKWDPARTTNPEDVAELKALQNAVNGVVEKCAPATVALKYGSGSGSGVIVSEDGLVLTAAHVIRDYPDNFKGKMDPPPLPFTGGKKLMVMLPDGEEVEGRTLGINQGMDSGMVKITGKPKGENADKFYRDGKWVFCPVGKSGDVKKQQWVVALGHPDGPKEGRLPVARLGRVYVNTSGFLRTDCTIVGGDSGGPLFNLKGEVIGVTNMKSSQGDNLGFAIPINYVKDFLRNRDAFSYDKDNPNTGYRYLDPPSRRRRGAASPAGRGAGATAVEDAK